MDFNRHSKLSGIHSFLSPSNPAWVNYEDDKLITRYINHQEAARGTAFHAYADLAIKLGQRQARNGNTINEYINDAIGFRMDTEQVLFYSENAFGTTDAISFRDDFLRIHDLKTGVTKGNMMQLRIYNALFCLEYDYHPTEIDSILRIYQSDDIHEEIPDPEMIIAIMEKIKHFDIIIRELKEEAGL